MNKKEILEAIKAKFFEKNSDTYNVKEDLESIILADLITDKENHKKIEKIIEKKVEESGLIEECLEIEKKINQEIKKTNILFKSNNNNNNNNNNLTQIGPFFIEQLQNSNNGLVKIYIFITGENCCLTLNNDINFNKFYYFDLLKEKHNKSNFKCSFDIKNKAEVFNKSKWYFYDNINTNLALSKLFEKKLDTEYLSLLNSFIIGFTKLIKSPQQEIIKNEMNELISSNTEYKSFAEAMKKIREIYELASLNSDFNYDVLELGTIELLAHKIDLENKNNNKNGIKI